MTLEDLAGDMADRLGMARGQLDLDKAAFELFTMSGWRDAHCYIEMIEVYRRIIDNLNRSLPAMVHKAQKRDGASWTDIGNALGISRQAAQQRFGS